MVDHKALLDDMHPMNIAYKCRERIVILFNRIFIFGDVSPSLSLVVMVLRYFQQSCFVVFMMILYNAIQYLN